MKIINALLANAKKHDSTSSDHLEKNRIRSTIEEMCSKYLDGNDDIIEFEALPSALPFVVSVLDEPVFLERYEYQQVADSLFQVRERELQIM